MSSISSFKSCKSQKNYEFSDHGRYLKFNITLTSDNGFKKYLF